MSSFGPDHHARSRLHTSSGWCWFDPALGRSLGLAVDLEAMRHLIDALVRASDQGAGRTLKNDRHSRVMCIEAQGRAWIVKRYPHRDKHAKMRLYHLLRMTLAWREWAGAVRLARAGLRVSLPLALIHDDRSAGEGLRQHLVLPYIPGRSVEQLIRSSNLPIATRRIVAEAVGRQIGRLSAAGWRNADLKPSNLVIDEQGASGGEPIIIDPTSIRRRRSRQAVFKTMRHLRQTCLAAGPMSVREQLACLRGALQTDPALRPPGALRLAEVARAVMSEQRD